MSKGFRAKDYPITPTGVRFQIQNAALQNVYDRCEALAKENIKQFGDRRVMQEGAKYHGVWLETQPMGGEMYATRDMEVALNNQLIFMEYQRRDGRMPGMITYRSPWDGMSVHQDWMQGDFFTRAAFRMYYFLQEDRSYLERLYTALKDYDDYLWSYRDSDGDGCLETWCMWDTGDDNNTRFLSQGVHAVEHGAWCGEEAPTEYGGLPFESAEYMAYNYSQRCVLAKISDILGNGEGDLWRKKAEEVRQKVHDYLWDDEKKAVYDRDRNNQMMYALSLENLKCMYHHVFTQEMADAFIEKHLMNSEEFNTPLPLPNIAANDPLFYVNESLNNFTDEIRAKIRPFMAKDTLDNSWSGPVEGLSIQRSLEALTYYGHAAEATMIGRKWIANLAKTGHFVQQYNPMDGTASPGDEGYGPTVLSALEYLTYLYGVDYVCGDLIWSFSKDEADSVYEQTLFGHQYRLIRKSGIAKAYCDDALLFICSEGFRVYTDLSGKTSKLICIEPSGAALDFQAGDLHIEGTFAANQKQTLAE